MNYYFLWVDALGRLKVVLTENSLFLYTTEFIFVKFVFTILCLVEDTDRPEFIDVLTELILVSIR